MSAITPKILVDSADKFFFEKPMTVMINEEGITAYASSQKIETLMQDLRKGPLVATGGIGPASYKDAPLKGKKEGYEIHYWQKGAKRLEGSGQSSIIILGATKEENRGYVYFVLSVDITKNTTSHVREHVPSPSDSKMYVVSHETFRRHVFDVYPTNSSNESDEKLTSSATTASKSSEKINEGDFVKRLSNIMPLNSILDRGIGEAACKAIGQDIFDKYKKQAGEDSQEGIEAMRRILEKVRTTAPDGKLRKQHIERAWNHVGDKVEQWWS